MLKHPRLTFDRVRQFLKDDLIARIVVHEAPMAAELDTGEGFVAVEPGHKWGPAYAEGRYRVRVKIPKDWAGWECGLCHGPATVWGTTETPCEATVFQDGHALGGLDFAHPYLRLVEKAAGGERFRLELQTYARNAETTVHGREMPRTLLPQEFLGFRLLAVDTEILALAYDVSFGISLVEALGMEDPTGAPILRALNDVANQFRTDRRNNVGRCRRILRDALESGAARLGHEVTALGHAHLDTAWLWPLSVTRLKMAHTAAVQLSLIDRYPDHVFVHSQASQYEWLEEEHPALFERVRKAARRGQWEPLGSMWVEADCNLPSGESLVRQFLYGKRYFRERFGLDTKDMWLPDVFGYSAALPQILRKFGIQSFVTQKLSWNQFNKIPHHTFWWKGIDGSAVWAHFPPADTYTGDGTPKQILEGVRKYKDHARSDRSLYVFGFGDGGGGPTEGQIESIRRTRGAPGMPAIPAKRSAAQFFRDSLEQGADLCVWSGELYFELHRGTYTSQAANKAANRYCEMLLRDAEALACLAHGTGSTYPKEALEAAWKTVLLNQFHDIFPGSSVKEVYSDSAQDYAEVKKTGEGIVRDCLQSLGAKVGTDWAGRPYALFQNSGVAGQCRVPWEHEEAPASVVCGAERSPVQWIEDHDGRGLVFAMPEAALGAVAVADLSSELPSLLPRLVGSPRRLENEEWAVRFDGNGHITSITSLDDDPIEFVRPGSLANVFQLFEDKPLFWDAWDIDLFSLETGRDMLRTESFELVEKGPARVAVELVKRIGESTLRQRISLGPTPGIRFDTWVDWRESEKMLKVKFPMNINTLRATCEIQFGHVERPTHRNTSWDMAQFEVCAQKWVDMSEGGHGIALLNDGKYGHDFLDGDLRLTLLRSPKAPDPDCDMGLHRFTYCLLPHYGGLQQSDVVASSYALNARPWAEPLGRHAGEAVTLPKLVSSSDRSLVVDTLKLSEDRRSLIVRLYECHNARGTAAVRCALPISKAFVTDLEENPLRPLDLSEGTIYVPFRPFEIVTLSLEM